MRRPTRPLVSLPALAVRAGALSAVFSVLAGPACAPQPPCVAVACAPECPRDAHRDPSGRCACTEDSVLVLGACVPPAVGDAYCGPAERMGRDGCSSRACAQSERLDVVTGQCIAATSLSGAPEACSSGAVPLASAGHAVCAPREATCPRGTHRDGARCARPAACPAGALPEGAGCRPIVLAAPAPGRAPTVDVGAWVALVIGPGGGHGSDDLCSRLARRPEAFQVPRGETRTVIVRVAFEVPDEDISRVSARVSEGSLPQAPAGRVLQPWLPPAAEVVESAVAELLEPLRGLGGESSCAALETIVLCELHGA